MSSTPHQLTTPLKRLRLSGTLDTLEMRTQQATTEQWSYAEFILTSGAQPPMSRTPPEEAGTCARVDGGSDAGASGIWVGMVPSCATNAGDQESR